VGQTATHCSSRPQIVLHKALQQTVKAALTAIRPTARSTYKEILGFLRECGREFEAEAVEEANPIDATDGLLSWLDLPELVSGATLFYWYFGVEASVVKAWVSSINIVTDCTPAAGFGTCQVHSDGDQLSIGTGNWQIPTLSQIVEDPGGWTGFGGSTIHPPDRGVYTVMALAQATSFFGSIGQLSARIQVQDGTVKNYFETDAVPWSPSTAATIIMVGDIEVNNDMPAFNMATMANSGPLYFGTSIQRLVVSR
jgi:hypothetical protein